MLHAATRLRLAPLRRVEWPPGIVIDSMGPLTNWAGNQRYGATALLRPRTLTELRRLVADAAALRILNTGHSFNAIADCDVLVGLDQLDGAQAIEIDRETMSVAVGPTVTYAQLAVVLEAEDLALANMASLPHISVAGGIATGTHGSGDRLGNLATSVRAVHLLTSEGEQIEISVSDPRFSGAVIHLGALGIIVGVTLAVEPSYQLRQDVYLGMDWGTLDREPGCDQLRRPERQRISRLRRSGARGMGQTRPACRAESGERAVRCGGGDDPSAIPCPVGIRSTARLS